MASKYMTLLLLFLAAGLTSAAETGNISRSHELDVAIDEMTKANYFTFVTLLKMSPLDDSIQGNVTFLMPRDQILSKSRIPHDSLSDFLLHHSIPSPLLFDHLQRLPSGSTLPSSDSDYILHINNNGRKSFYLNNVRIISPNICTAGSSIRCHGVDGVLDATMKNTPPPSCSNTSSPVVVAFPPATGLPPAASPVGDHDQIIAGAPLPLQHGDTKKSSGAPAMAHAMSVKLLMTSISISVLGFNLFFLN